MDIVNSQSVTSLDAYYHCFTKVGTYTWGFIVKQKYVIQVQPLPNGQANKQTIIQVTYQNGSFQPDQANIAIFAGDSVSWENTTTGTGFSVVGDNRTPTVAATDSFSNRKLGVSDAFSHLFATPSTASPYVYNIVGGAGGPNKGVLW